MSEVKFYPNIRKLISQVRNPPTNVSKFGNANAFLFLFFVVFATQVEKSGMASPDGYASSTSIIGLIIFLFLSMRFEIITAMSMVIAAQWRFSMPDYLGIGVLQGVEDSEKLYRNTLVRFYRNQEINKTITFSTLTVAGVALVWALYDSVVMTNPIHDLSIASATITTLVMTGHLILSYVCSTKREKWASLSNEEINDVVQNRFKNYPNIEEEIPSIDELEELLESARLSDRNALGAANYLETVLHSSARRLVIISIIIGVCTFLILL